MPFQSMAIKLPSDKQRKTPRMELVAFSRATEYKSLCLVGKLSKTMLLNIGVGKSYKKKEEFEAMLYKLQQKTVQKYVDLITNNYSSNTRNKLFGLAFYSLVKWWREITSTKMKCIDVNCVNDELMDFLRTSVDVPKVTGQIVDKSTPKKGNQSMQFF